MWLFPKWLSINVKPHCLHDSVPYILDILKCSQGGKDKKKHTKHAETFQKINYGNILKTAATTKIW